MLYVNHPMTKLINIIEYDQKNYICDLHNEAFNSYCKDCKKDICLMCEGEHNDHNIIYYGKIMQNIKNLKDDLNNQRKKNKYIYNWYRRYNKKIK